MENKSYFNSDASKVAEDLETSSHTGLSNEEAKKRLAEYGPNEFTKKKRSGLFAKFIGQFKSFMIIVLLVAAAVSGIVGVMHGEGFTDALIILAIVVLNAFIGMGQEAKAEKSLDALERMSSPKSKVMRDGSVLTVDSKDLVPGDIVILDAGDAVPADLRLFEAVNLKIDEAALTGESVPEEKFTHAIDGETAIGDQDNMAFSSTIVTYGRGMGIVVATGMHSQVGKIASMIQSVPEVKTPMQERLDKLGKFLGIGALVVCLLIFVVGVLQGREIVDMFMIAVSLAAAAIPEGLPAVSTIVLAVGVQRLVKKNAIVRNLPSVETLGSTSVICSDKTGTLTQNRMTVVKIYADGKILESSNAPDATQKLLTEAMVLANDAKLGEGSDGKTMTGDPTETALLTLGLKYGIIKNEVEAAAPRVGEIPFDSERKMMTTIHGMPDGKFRAFTKGGLDEVLANCDRISDASGVRPLTDDDKKAIASANAEMASGALRVLSAAYKDLESKPENPASENLENEMVFIGMAGMIDPPREEVKAAVEKCRDAGIRPVMITGDHKITASAIAEQLGIKSPEDNALSGTELDKMSDAELLENARKVSVFARVAPEHKVRIVKAFQGEGEVVAMTGDGVNDAPALKLANIGVAMGITGTDVSKEAADVVLTDDNFATIVSAIEEGRRIYDNILKAILFMLSTNVGEILVLFTAVMLNWEAPLLAIHILWINLVTDSLPALALSVDPAQPGIMKHRPIDSRRNIMTPGFSLAVGLQGVMIAALSLIAFRIGIKVDLQTAQTMTFAVLAFTQITHVLNVRSRLSSAFKGMFSNKYLLGALAVVAGLMLIVIEIPYLHDMFRLAPLDAGHWMWVVGLSLAPLPIAETVKFFLRIYYKRKS